jgi:predicted nucleotidyltransferase
MAMNVAEDSLREAAAIARRVLGPQRVRMILFGSRARGGGRPTSDIDLALLGDGPLPPELLSRLRDAFEESNIPYAVDVVDLSQVTAAFREKVLREGREWAA